MYDQILRGKLIELKRIDLDMRDRLAAAGELSAGYQIDVEAVHRKNALELREIIEEYGWPGKSLVGDDGAYAAWFILQHSICR